MIPVIDLRPLQGPGRPKVVTDILNACEEIGFLTITGTGIDPARLTAMRDTVRAIFDVPEESKWRQAITRDNYRGYIPMGFFAPNDGSGSADLYEGYKLHAETPPDHPIVADCALYGLNRWPEEVPEAELIVLGWWREMDRIADLLLGALEEGLALPAGTLTEPFHLPLTNMTLLHYPPQDEHADGYGIHPHKDTSALTLIAPDPVGGLEVVTRGGGWISPETPDGALVVNIGDVLELWSGGRLVSTPHRVINRSGRERYSFPYFAVPRHDVTVSPLLPPLPGFDRPSVHSGHWSAEIWRTNWPDEQADTDTPELGTLHV